MTSYIILRQLTNLQEYDELLGEFMSAVKQNYGEKVLVQVSCILCFFVSSWLKTLKWFYFFPSHFDLSLFLYSNLNMLHSLKTSLTTTPSSCSRNTLGVILYSMMIFRYSGVLSVLCCSVFFFKSLSTSNKLWPSSLNRELHLLFQQGLQQH